MSDGIVTDFAHEVEACALGQASAASGKPIVAGAATAFTEDGQLADTDAGDGLARLVRRLIAAGRLFAR